MCSMAVSFILMFDLTASIKALDSSNMSGGTETVAWAHHNSLNLGVGLLVAPKIQNPSNNFLSTASSAVLRVLRLSTIKIGGVGRPLRTCFKNWSRSLLVKGVPKFCSTILGLYCGSKFFRIRINIFLVGVGDSTNRALGKSLGRQCCSRADLPMPDAPVKSTEMGGVWLRC